jgi:hypothetical protein
MNPFYTETIRLGRKNIRLHALAVDERLRCVERFDARQCRAALKVDGLQKTVRTAIERRLRKLSQVSP